MINIAQIGCGYWGPNVLRSFLAQKDCRVKLVVETSPSRRAFVKEKHSAISISEDFKDALDDSDIDAIVIATPAESHYKLTKMALASGKHVLVEKPLAMSVKEADELIGIALAKKLILMAGHTFIYNAAVRRLKQFIDDGELGRIYYIYSQRLNLGLVRSDVNVWWNLAPHDISILLYMMNGEMPVRVAASGMVYLQPGIDDVVFATLTWKNGVTAHVHMSWLDPSKVRRMTIVGSRKMIVYDDIADDKLVVLDKGVDLVPMAGDRMDYDNFKNCQLVYRTGEPSFPKIDFIEPLKVEAAHFLECVRTGTAPITGSGHARNVVAVLEAAERSLRKNGTAVNIH